MSDRANPPFARMPWYPRDFDSSTEFWPLEARAVYRELLDAQWNAGNMSGPGTLPDDERQLQQRARATAAHWKIAWPLVEPKFPKVEGGRRNARLEEHRLDAVRVFQARQKGARAANQKMGRGHGTLSE